MGSPRLAIAVARLLVIVAAVATAASLTDELEAAGGFAAGVAVVLLGEFLLALRTSG